MGNGTTTVASWSCLQIRLSLVRHADAGLDPWRFSVALATALDTRETTRLALALTRCPSTVIGVGKPRDRIRRVPRLRRGLRCESLEGCRAGAPRGGLDRFEQSTLEVEDLDGLRLELGHPDEHRPVR